MPKITLTTNELINVLFDKWIFRLDNNKKLNAYLKHFPSNAQHQAEKYFRKCINEMYNGYNCYIITLYKEEHFAICVANSIKDITEIKLNYSDFFIKSNLIKKIEILNKNKLIKDLIE
jgi:hypothetical protein